MLYVCPTIQEDPTKKSEEELDSSDQKGLDQGDEGKEDAVDMSQDFGGEVTDLPKEGEEEEESEGLYGSSLLTVN